MAQAIPSPFFILEIANNHMGDIAHGIKLIRAFAEVCKKFPFNFAFKLQYRDLDTFIHPSMRGRNDIKLVKRFSETKLTRLEFDSLVAEIQSHGFIALVTPFDEVSVGVIEEQNLDIIKIGSCSITDWPLLERIVKTNKAIIASTAGATLENVDRVVSFFLHREKEFVIMHCVGEYPTPDENMNMGQIDLLRNRYNGVRIGFSTHESPSNTDNVKIAIAKGCTIFEKHIGLPTDKYAVNEYSATPEQIQKWLEAAQKSFQVCGQSNDRFLTNEKEAASLRSLRRGAFAKRNIKAGQIIQQEDVYFSFPSQDNQISANDWSKYSHFVSKTDITLDQQIDSTNTNQSDIRNKVWDIAQKVKALLRDSKVIVPGRIIMEISHHYGLENFDQTGLTMLTVVNRGYCKKLLVVLPGQNHPEQFHNKKEETFHVLFGEIEIKLNNVPRLCKSGDVITVEPTVRHAFNSVNGAVIEEISLTHFADDSFYKDEKINTNKSRKTLLSYWMD